MRYSKEREAKTSESKQNLKEKKKLTRKVSFLRVRKEEIQPSFVISCGFLLPYFLHHFFPPPSGERVKEKGWSCFFFRFLRIQSSIFLSFFLSLLYYCFLCLFPHFFFSLFLRCCCCSFLSTGWWWWFTC